MQWCSLFSSASKYSISIRPSRYKRVAYGFLPLGTCLVILISFSYAYIPALVILVACIIGISIYLSLENKAQFTHYLTMSSDGNIFIGNESFNYQILATSRLSFIGCWLELQQSTNLINLNNQSKQIPSKLLAPTHLPLTHRFIFKDSLSEQDYARIVSVLKQIH